MVEFFIDILDIFESDLLAIIEEYRINRRILANFNSTFLSLISKVDQVNEREDYRPISICNCTRKIIAKFIASRLKNILSSSISQEQLAFLKGRHVHKAIGIAQEVLHTAKTKKIPSTIIKVDLSRD